MNLSTAPQARRQSSKPNGFTLIEMMIVVAVVGILAAVAYPSYMSQVRKSRRSDAVAALSAIQQAQERWRANNPQYTTDLAALGFTTQTPGTYYTQGSYYTLAIATSASPDLSPTGTRYETTATAVTGKSQANDAGCTTLTVRFGTKLVGSNVTADPGNTNYYPEICWSK